MSSVFYAYFRNVNDDVTYRYVAAFASREIADEWWRAVSESSNIRFANSVKRITPQLYTHDPTVYVVYTSLTTPDVAPGFLGKVVFTLLPNRDVVGFVPISSPDMTDHVSGNIFYIRSKANPKHYWYCPPGKSGFVTSGTPIYTSTKNRSRFRVTRIPKDSSTPNGTVMIDDDKIYITLAASADLSVTTRQTPDGISQVILGSSGTMRLGDLKRSFRADSGLILPCFCGSGSNGKGQCTCGSGDLVRELVKTNDGEEWELFN